MINEQIRDREIRLIGEDGEQLGIMSAREAMKIAQEAELDLIGLLHPHPSKHVTAKESQDHTPEGWPRPLERN